MYLSIHNRNKFRPFRPPPRQGEASEDRKCMNETFVKEHYSNKDIICISSQTADIFNCTNNV